MKRTGLMVLVLLSAAGRAHADVIPPEVAECQNRKAGDACTGGVCVASTCSRADYAHWDRDASAGPPSVAYDCVKCSTSAVVSTSTATDTGSGAIVTATGTETATSATSVATDTSPVASATETTSASSGSSSSVTAVDTATGSGLAANATATGTGTDTGKDDSGCSVGGSATRSLGPWLLAGLFGAAVMLIRRRRGK